MKSFLLVAILFVLVVLSLGTMMTVMPGNRLQGAPGPLNELETELAEQLKQHVEALALDIGPRSSRLPDKLLAASDYIEQRLHREGLQCEMQPYVSRGLPANNLVVDLKGSRKPEDVIIVGAHFDTSQNTPGADDNASGTAVLLEVARALSHGGQDRTMRFVFFSNGAEPCSGKPESGSGMYAKRCADAHEKVLAVIVLDSLGCYSDAAGSQSYPFPLSFRYPDRGNFVEVLGDMGSFNLVSMCTEMYRSGARMPCEGGLLPNWMPGVSVSDDASFRAQGFPALRITDTGPLRNKQIGTQSDTHDRLDYERMARTTGDLIRMIGNLAQRRTDLH
jgi:hypothetical protein